MATIHQWQHFFSCQLQQFSKEKLQLVEFEWSEWQPVPKESFDEGWDFENYKNRKMFFIMRGHALEERYILV